MPNDSGGGMDWGKFGLASGLGGLGAGLGSLFGNYQNPSDAAAPWMNRAMNELPGYFNPYIQAGQRQLPGLESQYGQMTSDPGGFINHIGQGYQQSPGYQFALQQGLGSINNSAAAGGMAGSLQNQQQAGGMATNLANQDYYNYLQHALGAFGQGQQGMQDLYHGGMTASMGLGQDMASLYGSQGQLAYEGANSQNQHDQGMWGDIFGSGMAALPFLASGGM